MESDKTKTEVGASLLETLTSALYADPIVVFREYVQNSVDSFVLVRNAGRDFKVSITINLEPSNLRTSSIIIDDNGAGIPREKFESTMYSLGNSGKKGEVGQIGFRGIGRLAGLAFSDRVVFFNKKYGQRFELDGKQYRAILNSYEGRRKLLDDVMQTISQYDATATGEEGEGFRVELHGISEELLDLIIGRSRNLRSANATSNGTISREFIDALRMMLPLPYPENFDKRNVIEKEYERLLSKKLSESEFTILLNGERLYKNVSNIDDRAFVIIPVKIYPSIDDAPEVIGLLWVSFSFVLRSVGRNFGVAVRSRNMLVQGGPVFASEAAQGHRAMTTYGQYLASVKAITGELLLNTTLLSDNSRRDWFKLDTHAFQLREQICAVMNSIHQYRYAISRYVNSDDKDEELKQKVFDAYSRILKSGQEANDLSKVKGFLAGVDEDEKARVVDERSDVVDIRGYSKTQKAFYKKIMDYLYEYCDQGSDQLGLTHYYALKSYVVKRLNEEC
jgi:molecular chaperone HtpG